MAARNVAIGWISPGQVAADFAISLAATIMEDHGRHKIGPLIGVESSPRVAEGRSQVVDAFLRSDAEWLMMIDADMGWEWSSFDLLCRMADKDERPIMGGLCFGGGRSTGVFPTIYALANDENGGLLVERQTDYPKDALIKVAGTGAAFLLAHRSVFVAMKAAFGKDQQGRDYPYPWFEERVFEGRPMGEDMTFCFRATGLGLPIFVHTGAKTTHLKSHRLSEAMYEEVRRG